MKKTDKSPTACFLSVFFFFTALALITLEGVSHQFLQLAPASLFAS